MPAVPGYVAMDALRNLPWADLTVSPLVTLVDGEFTAQVSQ